MWSTLQVEALQLLVVCQMRYTSLRFPASRDTGSKWLCCIGLNKNIK